MKASGIKTAPLGHHVTKADRRAKAKLLAQSHREGCTRGNHK